MEEQGGLKKDEGDDAEAEKSEGRRRGMSRKEDQDEPLALGSDPIRRGLAPHSERTFRSHRRFAHIVISFYIPPHPPPSSAFSFS
eukprot:9493725-Pyramimonas_sp.AAC.3